MRNGVATVTVFAIWGVACAPQTVVRRSALVPTPAPPDFAARTLAPRAVEVSAGLSPLLIPIFPKSANAGDPGVYAPTRQAFGALRVGLGLGLDAAFIVQHGAWSASEESAFGVPPVPGVGDVYGMGIGLRGAWRVGSRFRIGAALEMISQWVPYAVWECTNCPAAKAQRKPDPSAPTFTDAGGTQYQLASTGRETFMFTRFAVAASADFGALTPFVSVGVQSSLENVGFDNNASYGSTLRKGTPFTMIALGLEGRVSFLRFTGQLVLPTGGPVSYGPGLMLSMGARLF